jgi:putative membrane protein
MRTSDIVKGALAGAAAGLVASWVMNEFQGLWSAVAKAGEDRKEDDEPEEDDEPATTKAADLAAETVTGEPVPEPLRKYADAVVHYTTGAMVGAVYGALAEVWPGITKGRGAAYGGMVAVGLDEGVVPALGLGPGPLETPPETHAYGFSSHFVFGWALEAARRFVRPALD